MARGFVSALVVITRGKVQPASKRRLSKSFRSAERPPHRARGVRYKKRAHDPVPHRSARGANSSFKEASAHREAAQESNRGCRFGIAAARRGAHERGLTTRCSGLAALAAELDIVRPQIDTRMPDLATAVLPGPRGVRGWLLFLVVNLCIIGPLFTIVALASLAPISSSRICRGCRSLRQWCGRRCSSYW